MITALGIKSTLAKAKQSGSDAFISDDTGQRLGWRLVLRCQPTGSASWLFRYTHNGTRNQIKLGNLNTLDIQSARAAASNYAAIYKETTDIRGKLHDEQVAKLAEHAEEQAKAAAEVQSHEQREKYTLSSLMTMYVDYLDKQGKCTTAKDVDSLSKHLSSIANKPAAEVSKRDLVTVQRALLEAGKGRTANKLRSFVRAAYALVLRSDSDATAPSSALDFATIGGVESNPAALLAVAKGFNGTRDRILTDSEMFKLLEHTQKSGIAGMAVRATVLLGGQRMAQLLRSRTTDVQDNFLVLLDPKGKRDVPRRHPIPLEGIAGDVIVKALARANLLKTDLLFSSTGKVQLSACTVSIYVSSVSAELVQSGVSKTPFTLADLRRTVETRLAGMKVSKDHRAYLQSHGLSGVQTRHYDRHEYEVEKREALKLLHRWIASLGKIKLTTSLKRNIKQPSASLSKITASTTTRNKTRKTV